MEEVLIDLYNRAQSKGYKKSLEDFTSVLYTNDNVLQDMYGYVQSKGYSKSMNDFENLIGKKKNELDIQPTPQVDMVLPSEDGSLESPEKVKGEEQTFFDTLLPGTEIADVMGDMLMNVRQGLAQGASIDDALKVMRQGSDATEEDIQKYIEAVTKMQDMPVTDEMKDFSRIYEQEDNKFLGFYKGLKENPSVIPGIIAQSVANMANLSTLFGAAKGAAAGGVTGSAVPVLGTAAGAVYGGIAGMTNTLEKGLAFTEFLQEEIQRKGLEFNNDGIKAVLEDPEAIKRVKRRTVGRGAAIATVNALTAGLAGKAGRAAGKLTKLPVKDVARRATEMVGGGAGESLGRAVAGQEQDVAEIGFEAIGEIGDPTSIFNLSKLTRKPTGDVQSSVKISSYEVNGQPVNKSDIVEILDSGDVETIAQINYKINNDPELSSQIENARADAIIARDIKETFDNDKQPSDNQLKNLIDIQNKITKAKNNPTPRAKQQLENLQTQFKTISDAIQEPSTETIPVPKQPETSPAVGTGDTQGAVPTGEIASEETQATQPAEEVETQVETQESEVETYTLPEDPKERIADFEIIDNTKGQEDFEIDEEGNGKWIITNIKTGLILPLKTKADAYNELLKIRRGKNMFDYGEGEPVVEEFRIQEEESRPLKQKIKNLVDKITDPPDGRGGGFDKKWFNPGVMERAGIIKDEDVKEYYLQSIENGEVIKDPKEFSNKPFYTREFKRLGITPPATVFATTKEVAREVTPPLSIKIEPGTQTEQVTQLLEQRGELTISEAANELGILEPNVRRIFGVGAKEGKFERVGKGVYTLTQGDKTYAVIEGNALIELPKLIEQGIKFDAIYLDPPYEVKSGNRDIAQFSVINPAEFAQLSNLMPQLLKNEDSPVLLQYTQAQQPQNKKERASYLRSLSKAGLNLAADIQKIEYIKMTQDMKKEQKMAGRNLREDIFVLTKSGKVKDIPFNLKQEGENFELRYPMVDTRTKKFKGFKGDTRKSLEALADLIEGFVPEGGIILDPFLGTGTTVEAAIETGREAVGIELDPAKAEKSRKQIEKKTKKIKSTQTKSEPKKVKQAVPEKPTEPAPKPGLSPELQDNVNKIIPAIDRITLNGIRFGLDNIASQVKVGVTRRNNVLLQKARSTPSQYIDQSLGVNNSTVIADNTFTTLAEAQAQLYGNFNKVQDELSVAQKLIDFEGQGTVKTQAGISRARNKSLMDTYELGLYMQVREADANKIGDEFNNEIAPNPVDMLDFTIDNERQAEAKALKQLKNKYVKNGKINKEDIKNNFSAAQNKALKTLDKKNKELLPKMQEIAERRNFSFTPIKDYIHRAVLKSETSDKVDVLKAADKYSNQSTRAKSSFERTEGIKPIDYNPFNATLLGTQETFLDYYVTPGADKVQAITEELKNIYKNGNEGQQKAVTALDESVKEILRLTYLRSFMGARNINAGTKVHNEFVKNSYRAMLSSGTRALSEYLGNTLMLISQDPQVIKDTYTKYKKLGKDPVLYRDILLNLGSAEIRKLTDKKTLSNKNIDVNDYLNLGQSRESMIANPVFQKMDQIMKYGPKQLYKGFGKLADELMSMGDVMVARPLWPAKFAFEFKKNVKKQLGEDIDISDIEFEKIGKGTSKFVTDNKYKKARLEAVRKSDRTLSQFITSGNPMYRIIKNIETKSGEGINSLMDYYRMLNSYMANFNLNEYASSRFAIGALFKSGYLTKREAIALQAGILARMSSYVAMYSLFSQLMDEFLGAPEEENEDDFTNTLKRQLLGSAATLVFRGGIGNMWSLPINTGIEKLNKEYLENLRNGAPYDAYDNSIVYSLISLDDFGEKKFTEILAPVLAGRYGPYAKSLFRSVDLGGKILNAKTLEAREKATEELLDRMVTFEFLGLLGFIPLYKDARRIALKKRFSDANAPGGSVRR